MYLRRAILFHRHEEDSAAISAPTSLLQEVVEQVLYPRTDLVRYWPTPVANQLFVSNWPSVSLFYGIAKGLL